MTIQVKAKRLTDKEINGNAIPYTTRLSVYQKALNEYGWEGQAIVALEELSEVQKEICKCLRGYGSIDHLAEEIADATIMLEQLRYMFGLDEYVCRHMDEKVQRLADNLEVGENGL